MTNYIFVLNKSNPLSDALELYISEEMDISKRGFASFYERVKRFLPSDVLDGSLDMVTDENASQCYQSLKSIAIDSTITIFEGRGDLIPDDESVTDTILVTDPHNNIIRQRQINTGDIENVDYIEVYRSILSDVKDPVSSKMLLYLIDYSERVAEEVGFDDTTNIQTMFKINQIVKSLGYNIYMYEV